MCLKLRTCVYIDVVINCDENDILNLYLFFQALIWSKMSTGLPIEISSSMKSQSYTSFCRLDIDIHRYCSSLWAIVYIRLIKKKLGTKTCSNFLIIFFYDQKHTTYSCTREERWQRAMAWSWNSSCNRGKLDHISCMYQFMILLKFSYFVV